MAPNKKQIAYLTDSIADVDLVVDSKFLPLTDPREAELQSTLQQRQQQQEQPIDGSYWDWQPDEEVLAEEKKESHAALFSAERYEKNLIQDGQRGAASVIVVSSDADTAENDAYWSEASAETANATKPQHHTYWYAPADPREALIQAIVRDEADRKVVSADNIEQNLLRQARNLLSSTRSSGRQNPHYDDYWNFDTTLTDGAYSQAYWDWSEGQDGQVQQLLSTDRLVENLKKMQTSSPSCSGNSTARLASSDDYWSWAEGVPLADDYWNWNAQSSTVAVGGAGGYWDGM